MTINWFCIVNHIWEYVVLCVLPIKHNNVSPLVFQMALKLRESKMYVQNSSSGKPEYSHFELHENHDDDLLNGKEDILLF